MSFIICIVLLCFIVASACLSTPLLDKIVVLPDQILTTAPRFLAVIPGSSNLSPINELVDIVLDFGTHVKALCVGVDFDTLSRWIFRVAGICLLTMVRRSAERIELGEDEYDVKSQQYTLPSPLSDADAEVDVFAPASPLSEQCDYARHGIPHVSSEGSIWESSKYASALVEPSLALSRSVHFSSPKAAHPSLASAFVSVATAAVFSLASRAPHYASALRSRYLPFIAGAHVASAPSSLDLASLSALVSSQPDHCSSSTSNAASKRAHRRMFGTDVPFRSMSAPRADLEIEIEDGSYLRAALCIADTNGAREGGFWPEIDGHVQRARGGRPGAWYADGDEMRGWVFPGRERVPELECLGEDASESYLGESDSESCGEWAVADNEAYEVLQRTVEVVDS